MDSLSWSTAFAGVSVSLNIIAFIVFCLRMYTRTFPICRLSADDYCIAIAWPFLLGESVLLMMTVPFTFGRSYASFTLQDVTNSLKFANIAQPLWSWGMAATKNSIALMLLRLESNIKLRRFLWGNIILQVLLAVYNTLVQTLQCRPLRKVWDIYGAVPGSCWSNEAIKINIIITSIVVIATDIILALMPISFLRKVQRPMRERITIGILMGLGVIASAASIAKVEAAMRLQSGSTDATLAGIQMGMWSNTESLLAFICACIPCLRSPFQRLLKNFGLISTQKSTTARGYYNMAGPSVVAKESRSQMSKGTANKDSVKMKSLRSTNADADAESDEIILADDAIWRTTEVHVENEMKPPGRAWAAHRDVLESWDEQRHSPSFLKDETV